MWSKDCLTENGENVFCCEIPDFIQHLKSLNSFVIFFQFCRYFLHFDIIADLLEKILPELNKKSFKSSENPNCQCIYKINLLHLKFDLKFEYYCQKLWQSGNKTALNDKTSNSLLYKRTYIAVAHQRTKSVV